MKKISTALALAGLATSGVLALSATPAAAKGDDDHEVRVSGACNGGGTWKLKVKLDDGGLEVEGEVDTNVAGQTFAWNIKDNGVRVAKGTGTTAGRSGSFSVERYVANQPGTDTVVFRAKGAGKVCTGSIAYTA